jgi:hypothetical protein
MGLKGLFETATGGGGFACGVTQLGDPAEIMQTPGRYLCPGERGAANKDFGMRPFRASLFTPSSP